MDVNKADTSALPLLETERTDTSLDEDFLDELKATFTKVAGEDRKINYEEFKSAINFKQPYFATQYFRFFDRDGSGEIELDEFFDSVRKLLHQTDLEKLQFIFNVFDVNGDGHISPKELRDALRACVGESDLAVSEEQLDQLVTALLQEADVDQDGVVTFQELKQQLEKYPGLIENLSISPANWLRPQKPPQKAPILQPVRRYFTRAYIKNNLPYVIYLIVYTLLNIFFFTFSAVRYKDKNGYVIVARGCGMALNFNCALVIFYMCRRTLTALRNSPVGKFLPIDDSILLHKICGYVIGIHALVHTIMHLVNISILVKIQTNTFYTYWEYLLTLKPGIGWVAGFAPLSGVILDVILIIKILCSLPKVRGSGMFQLFYWTHMLYIVFIVLLILHGPIYWCFLLLPGCIFLVEKLITIYRWLVQVFAPSTYIEEVNLLQSKVTNIIISRPKNIKYKPGDYVFIRIPDVAGFEWHPFTLSSAPENQETLTLHIRTLGNWTEKLYDFYAKGQYLKSMSKGKDKSVMNVEPVEKALETGYKSSPSRNSDVSAGRKILDHRKVYVDGPYGTAAHAYTHTNHAVFVAAGIGVTPFASILQSILTQYRQSKTREGGFNKHFKLEKVDFIWVNRHIKDTEWFLTLLTQLEMEEAKESAFDRFFDLHLYMTGAKGKADLKGVGLQMALELVHRKEERDLLTGLKTRTQAGRPNWKELFKQFKEEREGDVHVFYCGSPAVAGALRKECQAFNFKFSEMF